MGIFTSKEERQQKKDEQAAKERELKEKLDRVKVTTGDVKREYDIVQVVFNIGASSAGSFGFIAASPEKAFRSAEAQLKYQAMQLGCDAVIHTQFEHRVTVDKGVVGTNQGLEVFAYGTAVKFT